MKDRYFYPAIFTEDEDGLAVEFPDLPGCYTCGQTWEEAFDMAREALGLHLYGMESESEELPQPATPSSLMPTLQPGQSVVIVEVWMPPIRANVEHRSVKKTLTIPKWLNDLAERHQVNFSQVLQEALKEQLGVSPAVRAISAGRKETSASADTAWVGLTRPAFTPAEPTPVPGTREATGVYQFSTRSSAPYYLGAELPIGRRLEAHITHPSVTPPIAYRHSPFCALASDYLPGLFYANLLDWLLPLRCEPRSRVFISHRNEDSEPLRELLRLLCVAQ